MKDRFQKVEGVPGFVKDTNNNSILNTDNMALRAYKTQKTIMSSAKNNSERLDKLEQEVVEIKDLLHKILGKL